MQPDDLQNADNKTGVYRSHKQPMLKIRIQPILLLLR